jgi:hypothetical protein
MEPTQKIIYLACPVGNTCVFPANKEQTVHISFSADGSLPQDHTAKYLCEMAFQEYVVSESHEETIASVLGQHFMAMKVGEVSHGNTSENQHTRKDMLDVLHVHQREGRKTVPMLDDRRCSKIVQVPVSTVIAFYRAGGLMDFVTVLLFTVNDRDKPQQAAGDWKSSGMSVGCEPHDNAGREALLYASRNAGSVIAFGHGRTAYKGMKHDGSTELV